jgi:hypothetical protein
MKDIGYKLEDKKIPKRMAKDDGILTLCHRISQTLVHTAGMGHMWKSIVTKMLPACNSSFYLECASVSLTLQHLVS